MTFSKETSIWAHTIVAAAISSAASSLAVMIVDPGKFNWSHDGLVSTVKVAVVAAAIGVLAVLKKSPLPDSRETPAVVVVDPQKVVVEQSTIQAPDLKP